MESTGVFALLYTFEMVPSVAKGVDRIVLGTVQLGLAYGRHAAGRRPEREHCFRVLDAAWGRGIRSFDTAEAYGDAAGRLSEWIASRGVAESCHVVTKIPSAEAGDSSAVERAVARFPAVATCTVMTHGAVEGAAFSLFSKATERAGALPGASVYEAHEVLCMASAGAIRVQAPVNAFDSRQRDAAWERGVPIDGRSVFLQGVLLERADQAEARAPGTGRMARAVQRASTAAGISPATALLASAVQDLRAHDRVVVGVDQPEELDAIVAAATADPHAVSGFRRALAEEVGAWRPDARSLDPRKWRSA